MTDPGIRTGDVVNDLGQNGKLMQVVAKASESVAEYREREDFDLAEYKAHPLLDVSDEDTVWTCVFLTSEPSASFSGTYDYPESRLARQPVEEANQSLDRVQESLTVAVLSSVFNSMERYEGLGEDDIAAVADHVGGIDPEIVSTARELATVDDHFDGGEGDE